MRWSFLLGVFKKILWSILYVILTLVLAISGALFGSLLTAPMKSSLNPAISFAALYASYIGVWIVVIVFCLITKKNREILKLLGKGGKGNTPSRILGLGIPLGFGINLLVAIVAILCKSISISFNEFNILYFLMLLFFVMVQSGAEELTQRLFLYEKLKSLYPKFPFLYIGINSLVFAFLHIANNGFTFTAFIHMILSGIIYSLLIYYYDSLWSAIVTHTTWNFCQSILLGLPNSGFVSAYSVFKLDAASSTAGFAYDPVFGIEGSWLTIILEVIACVILVCVGRKKKLSDAALISENPSGI